MASMNYLWMLTSERVVISAVDFHIFNRYVRVCVCMCVGALVGESRLLSSVLHHLRASVCVCRHFLL